MSRRLVRLVLTLLASSLMLSYAGFTRAIPLSLSLIMPTHQTRDLMGPPSTVLATLPPQGLYDSCVPTRADCINHLNTLAGKGFQLILNYGELYGNTRSLQAYADRAASLGMKVIWSIQYRANQPANWMIAKYNILASESRCATNRCLIRYVVNLVKGHPATWGYYIADEVNPKEYSNMKPWTDLIHQLDPNHPRLFVTSGSNDPMEQYYGFYSYMRTLADVFGPDYYPYGYIDPGTTLSRYTGVTAAHAQYWADHLNGKSVMVLQAFALHRYADQPLCLPWPSCASFPTYEQMRAQRDQTLMSSHPALILWWTYEDILKTDNPSKHLSDLAAAAFAPAPYLPETPTANAAVCPDGWKCEDVGNPAIAGSQTQTNERLDVQGAGWDIWARWMIRADQFHYVWRAAADGGSFRVQVLSQANTDPAAKAGLMLRKSVDPVSPYYAIFVTPGKGIHVQYRKGYAQDSLNLSSTTLELPVYLRIDRIGTTFKAYKSSDGIRWTFLNNSSITLPSLSGSLMAGLAVTSRNEASLGNATFGTILFP